MTRPSILLADATPEEIEAWLERANIRILATLGATQEDHERLVRRLGVLVIESQHELNEIRKGERSRG